MTFEEDGIYEVVATIPGFDSVKMLVAGRVKQNPLRNAVQVATEEAKRTIRCYPLPEGVTHEDVSLSEPVKWG